MPPIMIFNGLCPKAGLEICGWGQVGGRLTLIIIKNFLKLQAECRLGVGWGQADLYHHKEL